MTERERMVAELNKQRIMIAELLDKQSAQAQVVFCLKHDIDLAVYVNPTEYAWWSFASREELYEHVCQEFRAGEVSEGYAAHMLGIERFAFKEHFAKWIEAVDKGWFD